MSPVPLDVEFWDLLSKMACAMWLTAGAKHEEDAEVLGLFGSGPSF